MLERSTLLQFAPGRGLFTQDIKKPQTKTTQHTTKHLLLKLLAVVLLDSFHFSEKSYTHTNRKNVLYITA